MKYDVLNNMIGNDDLPFPETWDAQIWAKKFIEEIKDNPSMALDEELMIGWFANSIMKGYDKGYNKRYGQGLNEYDTHDY